MATTTNFSVRMDSDIKKQCEALYGELGINFTTVINAFLRQFLRVGGFPFDVRMEQPNKETFGYCLEKPVQKGLQAGKRRITSREKQRPFLDGELDRTP